jgi:hypothetical protein
MLLKKGQINTAWKSRFFVLEEHELSYYKSPEDFFVTPDDMTVRHLNVFASTSDSDFALSSDKTPRVASGSDKTPRVANKREKRLGYIDLCGASVISASNAGQLVLVN